MAVGRIVSTSYRYKRPPRKRKAVALEVPAIVRTKKIAARVDDPSGERKGWVTPTQHSTPAEPGREPPVTAAEKVPAIVTVRRRRHAMHAHLLDDLTPEEVQRRGDAADALWRELVRRVREGKAGEGNHK